jgi:hypothetical protein
MLVFIFSVSTFIFAEFKFGFRMAKTFIHTALNFGSQETVKIAHSFFIDRLGQEVLYNLLVSGQE